MMFKYIVTAALVHCLMYDALARYVFTREPIAIAGCPCSVFSCRFASRQLRQRGLAVKRRHDALGRQHVVRDQRSKQIHKLARSQHVAKRVIQNVFLIGLYIVVGVILPA